jgi:hypothetical protein
MEDSHSSERKYIARAILIGLVVIIISIIGYIVLVEIDFRNCYPQAAKKLNVIPTYEAIGSAILAQAQKNLNNGITPEQVKITLNQIAPIVVQDAGSFQNGGFSEIEEIKICSFRQNNIFLLINYTEKGLFEGLGLIDLFD